MPDKPPPRNDSSRRKAVALRYDQYREAPVLLGKGTGGALPRKSSPWQEILAFVYRANDTYQP
jgi:hypothetical protein